MPIYMLMEGIKGNVDAEGHKDWIELDSLNWGVGRSIFAETGNVKDREASAPNISEVTATKTMDGASPYLFTEACTGKGKKVKIHLCKTDVGKLETYMEYELEAGMISNYTVSTGGERPAESFSLNFTKVEMKYIPWKEDGTKGSPVPAGYDLEKAKKV